MRKYLWLNRLFRPIFWPLVLIAITISICLTNYTPNTFLTGWDTLHPEFNFPVNFQHLIFGVWRSDQGLGDISGHSAMSDIPRVFILWLFHFVLPLNFLRYFYVFLCLIIGPLGFYFLIYYLFKNRLIAFLSSLFYIFNLGTLQQFYVPFEMFPTQWAYLPWIILFSLRYLHCPSKKTLGLFFLATLLSTPQAYAAQLWYAFFVVYSIFLLLYANQLRLQIILPLTLFSLTLLINSFWLLPNLYYATTSTQNPLTNKSNRLYSQEYLLQNRATGTLANTSLIKGFYFNWNEYDFPQKNFENLTSTWNQHLNKLNIQVIGNLLFLLSFSGLIAAFLNKNKTLISLSPFFIIPFFLLTNSTPVIRIPFDLLLKINLFQELFRFIFTKVSIMFTFSVCLFLAHTLHLLFTSFSQPRFVKTFSLIFAFSLFIYCFPYFQGQLISPIVRLNIPSSYFELYQYLNQKNPGRILSLPLNEPSGWQYYSWKYQGSGFLWFGFPQSLLDRDSDRWEIRNEEAYREFHYPLYSNNSSQFLNSLYKYNVQYLLWDQSVIPTSPKNRDQIIFKYETQRLLNNLISQHKLTTLKQFGSFFLYQINRDSNLVKLQQIKNFIAPGYTKNYWDPQYTGYDYVTTNTAKDTYFPFRNVLNQTENIDIKLFNTQNLTELIDYQSSDFFSLNSTNPNFKIVDQSAQITALNSTQGFQLELPRLPHNQSYILGFKTKYISGLPLRFCLRNSYTNLCTLEDQVNKNKNFNFDYYLIPPMDEFNGYTLSLNSISFASLPSISQISDISIYTIKSDIFLPITSTPNQSYPLDYQIIFPNNSLIKISSLTNTTNNQYISLYQSFSPAWLAFYFDNYQIKFLDHYQINNWANGWKLDLPAHQSSSAPAIYILFWPQLLQFLGFALLIGSIVWILKRRLS